MNRAEVLNRIEELAVVPVVRAPSAGLALAAVEALLEGGLSVFEITLTVPGALGVIEKLVAELG
ncbi:MAG: 2-dehydro-3-deoxyphosphogluconate aldolase, partial [Myxococcota bacterium]|nr:2-dehydro-3-deoxyphosphogluconate aldolase [Myxococcota bacterium]